MTARFIVLAACSVLMPSAALAQGRPIEIGFNSGIGVSFAGGSNAIEVAVPVQTVTNMKIPNTISAAESTKAILRPPIKSILVSGIILNIPIIFLRLYAQSSV